MLTLPSGERISFGNNVNFIFETTSLKFVSPATISRVGVVNLDKFDVSNIANKWLKKKSGKLISWFNKYFFEVLRLALQLDGAIQISKVGLIHTALSHLNSCENEQHFLKCLVNGFSR